MRKISLVLLSVIILSCGSGKTADSKVDESIDVAVLAKDIQTSMEYLASDELEGRATGTEGIEKAAVFIEEYLRSNNIKSYFETYRDSFKLRDIIGYNIVGVVEGNDPDLKDEYLRHVFSSYLD